MLSTYIDSYISYTLFTDFIQTNFAKEQMQ